MPTRWLNQRLPQTLVIAQFLLYFDAFWAFLDFFSRYDGDVLVVPLARLMTGAAVLLYVFGAWGIANEKKRGYEVAIVASFLPLAARTVTTLLGTSTHDGIGYILLGGNIISAMFEYALIVLLLHSQSREHARVWFS